MGIPPNFYHPKKAKVAQGAYGHMLGNAIPTNMLMRLFPSILKSGGVLNPKACLGDYWAELVASCSNSGCVHRPSKPEPRRRAGPSAKRSLSSVPAAAAAAKHLAKKRRRGQGVAEAGARPLTPNTVQSEFCF